MTTEFKLPELGENIESGDVISVLVSVGDEIEEDQPVLELETDKATLEVPSSVSGVVKEIHVKEGDQANVGQTILTVDGGDGGAEAEAQPEEEAEPEAKKEEKEEPAKAKKEGKEEPAKAKKEGKEKPAKKDSASAGGPVEFKLPELGENIEGGDVIEVMVSVGDEIEQDQPVLEIETDKATVEVPASVSGVIKEIHVKAGDHAEVGQTILTVETEAAETEPEPEPEAEEKEEAAKEEPQKEEPEKEAKKEEAAPEKRREPPRTPQPTPSPAEPAQRPDKIAPAAPSVRRLARELGVDINEVPGSGPQGRISQQDVKNYVKKLNQERETAPTPAAGAPAAAPELPDFSKWGQVDRQRMSAVRRATARQMQTAWTNVAHVTNFDKADVTEVENLRKQYGHRVEAAGGKLTVTAILLKVVAAALKQFPKFNASIDLANEDIVYKQYYHIGVAVDTERGLLVPAIRDVDQKNIIELSVELSELAKKARDRKISLEDMQGSTFTITNLGGIGGTNFTPIVNHPEVAILGVARGTQEAVYRDGAFEPRLMMPLALSYDHRLIDGADAARFLRWVAEALEQPFLLTLEG